MYTSKDKIEKYMLLDIDSSFDAQINTWIEQVSEYIDLMTNRSFVVPTEATKRYYDGKGFHTISIDDFLTIDELRIDGKTVDDNDYLVSPANSTRKKRIHLKYEVFTKGHQNVEVTAEFGFPSVPLPIEWACTVLVAGIINHANKPSGDVQSENIGRYSVSYNGENQLKDFEEAKKIIHSYKYYRTL